MIFWILCQLYVYYYINVVYVKILVIFFDICKYVLGKMEMYVNDIEVILVY